jgi:uncharacterized protein (TIGR03067 family)
VVLTTATFAELMSVQASSAGVPPPVACTLKAASLLATGPTGAAGLIPPRVATLTDRVIKAMFLGKLNVVACVLLALGLAISIPCFGVALPDRPPAPGQPPRTRRPAAPPRVARQPTLRATLAGEKGGTAVAVSADGNLVASEGEDETVAFAPAPLPKPDTSKSELKKMEGNWRVAIREHGGRPMPARHSRDLMAEVKGDRLRYTRAGRVLTEWTLTFDLKKKPRALDMRRVEGLGLRREIVLRTIYLLEKDTLKIYHFGADDERPADFNVVDKRSWLMVLKRVRP